MNWSEILINSLISILGAIVSGVIVAIISNYYLEKRTKKREYKKELAMSLTFFEQLEAKETRFDPDYIYERLIELRHIYSNDIELKEAYNLVECDLLAVIRFLKNGGSATYNFAGNNYFNFKQLLNDKIKK